MERYKLSAGFGFAAFLTAVIFLLLNGHSKTYGKEWKTILYWMVHETDVSGLRLSEVRIPNHILVGNSARLECLYELDEGESLYSVKWYKDGNEFYRYHPKEIPPAKVLSLPGIVVDLDNSTDTLVTLQAVPLKATGRYRCEVLGEAPAFHTVVEHGEMTVIALPSEGPKITGGLRRYHIGDTARLWCVSGPSSPPASLSWMLNGKPAPPSTLRGPRTAPAAQGLTTTSLGLEFKVRPEHFKDGDLKLKCLSTIATLYWRSNEESVEGEKPQRAPVLESRDSAAGPDSRAHRVQATTQSSSCGSCNRCTLGASLIILHILIIRR